MAMRVEKTSAAAAAAISTTDAIQLVIARAFVHLAYITSKPVDVNDNTNANENVVYTFSNTDVQNCLYAWNENVAAEVFAYWSEERATDFFSVLLALLREADPNTFNNDDDDNNNDDDKTLFHHAKHVASMSPEFIARLRAVVAMTTPDTLC